MNLSKIIRSFFWILPFLFFILGFYFLRSFVYKKEFPTPNIIGKSTQEGLSTLSCAGLNMRLSREQESQDFPEGTILEQSPSPNQAICQNQHVFVVVTKRPKFKKVGNFEGKEYRNILPILRKLDSFPNIVWVQGNYPKGLCIAQDPSPQSILLKDQETTLYISSGSSLKYIIPDFKGMRLDEVYKIISSFNVNVDVINQSGCSIKDTSTVFVFDQTPMPGSIVDLEKKLYLQVLVK